MTSDVAFHQVTISEMMDEAPAVVSLHLERSNGSPMPPFEPGAHVEIQMPNGLRRSYSICSDPADLSHYTLGVLREENSRGGSAYIHEMLEPGDTLLVSQPKSTFALDPEAQRHVFIGGGIGITPFLPMLHQLQRDNADFHVHHLARDAESSCFLGTVRALAGERVTTYWSSTGARFDPARLGEMAGGPDTQVYCCGPRRLMQSVLESASAQGISVRFESFAEAPVTGIYAGAPFEVQVASTGKIFPVSDTQSMLEALRANGCDVPSSCEHGICGTCILKVLDGQPVHRDGVLTAELRKTFVAPCISRAKGRLVLDL